MNTKKKILFFCLLALCTALFLCGCGQTEKTDKENIDSINLSISIDYPAKAKKPDLKTLPFRVEAETTVLQAVELYGNVNNMSVLVDTTYATLEGVDGVINNVTLKTGEWQYLINGEKKYKPMGDMLLKDGDHLELVYTKIEADE